MREVGADFQPSMVRAALRAIEPKSQTRRMDKGFGAWHPDAVRAEIISIDAGRVAAMPYDRFGRVLGGAVRCRYGAPGDRIYVREAWRVPASLDAQSGSEIAAASLNAGYSSPWCPIQFDADDARRNEWRGWDGLRDLKEPAVGRYRHARFMPRWASRLILEVTALRVERLQNICRDDAIAEGLIHHRGTAEQWWGTGLEGDVPSLNTCRYLSPIECYRRLWESINGADAWDANPFVWVIGFRRVDAQERPAATDRQVAA